MNGVGYSLDTASSVGLGPIHFGSVTSGGPVVFGTPNPTATAIATSLTSSPVLLIGLGLIALAGVWIYVHGKRA